MKNFDAPAPPKILARTLVCLCLAGLALGWLGLEALRLVPPGSTDYLIDVVALAAGGAAFLLAVVGFVRYFRAQPEETGDPPAAERLGLAAAGALPAALRCLDQPALVVSENGRIAQVNPAAVKWLDALSRPGVNIGDVVDAADFRHALVKARGERQPSPALLRRRDGDGSLTARVADLGLQAGAVIVIDAGASPPAAPRRPGGRWGVAFDSAQSLTSLPMVALSLTRDDVGRVTDIGTVKLAGGRVFPTLSLEFVVAQRLHGHAGRAFVEVWPELARALTGAVIVASGADAVWAALQAELSEAGFAAVERPPLVDVGAMALRFDPAWEGLTVEQLAEKLEIAETNPSRRLARVAAALVVGPNGQGLGSVGYFIATPSEFLGDALKPASIASSADEHIQTP